LPRTGRLNTITISGLLKALYRAKANPIKIPTAFFAEIRKLILESGVVVCICNPSTQEEEAGSLKPACAT
jgi:hypothetical protein